MISTNVSTPALPSTKLPRLVLAAVYAFPPNRETLGGTAYLILGKDEAGNPSNLMVDCPSLDYLPFIAAQGGLRWLFISHRTGISRVPQWQTHLGCEVVIQEQEAYLLPNLSLTPFYKNFTFDRHWMAHWTPGHSPGSACLYYPEQGGVLFTGRHLLPNAQGQPVPLRLSKTFHWPRQLQSVHQILSHYTPETLTYLCPGANLGFLRGHSVIDQAYAQLQALDLAALQTVKPGL